MTAPIALASPAPAVATPSGASAGFFSSGSDFSFHDLLSIVNPLQHIPVVSTIYRALTGDTIGPAERIAGDTLYGGLWGFVSSVANVAFQQITGKDFGDTALALLEGDDNGTTAVASNATPAPSAAAAGSATNGAGIAPAISALASATPAQAVSNVWVANGPLLALQSQAAVAPASANPVAVASRNTAPTDGTPGARIASGPPRSLQSHATLSAASPDNAATLALMNAMSEKGIDPSLGQRALSAYRKSLAASPAETVPVI